MSQALISFSFHYVLFARRLLFSFYNVAIVVGVVFFVVVEFEANCRQPYIDIDIVDRAGRPYSGIQANDEFMMMSDKYLR